ncbi:MAG: hypothetical protein ACFFDT_07755 [Candidatus Hodarchaeota archaeon]
MPYHTPNPILAWQGHPMATLDQDPPVTDTWYTILDTTLRCRIQSLAVRQINDETNAKNIELAITLDGVAIACGPTALNNNTFYYFYKNQTTAEVMVESTTQYTAMRYTDFRGHSIKIQARNTSAAGTNQKLDGRCLYETLEEI